MLPPLTIATVVDPGVRLTLPESSAAVVAAPAGSGMWASSNTQVATVSQEGVVTAQNRGDAMVTATSEGKSGTAAVNVRND